MPDVDLICIESELGGNTNSLASTAHKTLAFWTGAKPLRMGKIPDGRGFSDRTDPSILDTWSHGLHIVFPLL
jgi:hypothetical protein